MAQDSWPFWGRTPTRLGNTTTIGPQAPTIAWCIQVDYFPSAEILEESPVIDSAGRIFVGHLDGVIGIDSASREVLWNFPSGLGSMGGPAIWGGRVLWGDSFGETFYCVDATSGQEIWREEGHFITAAPVVSPDGVVYFVDQQGSVCARWVADGGEVWTRQLTELILCSPTLDWPLLLVSGESDSDVRALDPLTGVPGWVFPTGRSVYGLAPMLNGRVYVGSWDQYLYCVDAITGQDVWSFWCEQTNRGSVAIANDGETIYTVTSGNVGILFAVSPDGDELWRHGLPGLVPNAPIVAGDGTIYLCSTHWTGSDYEARVHAIRPDGSELWAKLMPDDVRASPMLAPDGTLYVVCRDKYLYAFHDPPNADQGDAGEQAEPTRVQPLPPP